MYVLGYSGFTRDSRSGLGYHNPFAKTRQGFDSIFQFRDGEVPFQMFPLGFFGHDAAAALLKDGKVIACAAEERFIRAKFSLNLGGNTLLPQNAIKYCLNEAGISVSELAMVAHYCDFNRPVIEKRLSLLKSFISDDRIGLIRKAYQNTYDHMMDREIIIDQFVKMTGFRPENFIQIRHHHAHAASAFYPSGFKRALILTNDGTGELESSILAIGQDNKLQEIKSTQIPNSLGALYLIITVFLGFKSLGDEYKVMGLAGYGKPDNYRDFFKSLIELQADGSYAIKDMATMNFKEQLIDGLGSPRSPGDVITETHKDIAAALQESLETTVLHILRYGRNKYDISKLCMAGGVALNSSLNGAISRSGLFDEIFIQPASSDEGCSLGAAYAAYNLARPNRSDKTTKLTHVYLGPSYSKPEILSALKNFDGKLVWQQSANVTELVAKEIADGCVVGWFQGRMEFGPRALGNRSILADPRPGWMKDRINEKIKHREKFRPFAPAVLEEDAGFYFNMNGLKKSPYMLFVVPVNENQKKNIPAITHVDGTARIQTVSKKTNKRFWDLLQEFKKITGIPILLNTSFNVMNEPIVCNPTDAIRCFLDTDIDLLVLGNYIVRKNTSTKITEGRPGVNDKCSCA